MKFRKYKNIILILLFIFIVLMFNNANKNDMYYIYYFERLPYYHQNLNSTNIKGNVNKKNNSKNDIINNVNKENKNKGFPSGFLIEITEKIFKYANIKHFYILESPKRILEFVKRDKNSLSIGWYKIKEREDNYKFSEYIYQDKPFVIVINKYKSSSIPLKPEIANILKSNLTLGVIDGFSYGNFIDKMIKKYNPKKIVFPFINNNILNLVANMRCDYTFMPFEEVAWILKNNSILNSKLKIIKIKDMPKSNFRYLIFNKNVDCKILDKINKVILNFRNTEEYKLIINKYILVH